jgi:hypothetical protein
VEFLFDEAKEFSNGCAWVRTGNKWGLIKNPLRD